LDIGGNFKTMHAYAARSLCCKAKLYTAVAAAWDMRRQIISIASKLARKTEEGIGGVVPIEISLLGCVRE